MAEKVLVVDDVGMFVELMKSYLQRAGVRVVTARDGEEALEVCRKERPALVFMDLQMPVMNGSDSCRAIKRDPQLKSTAVVLITTEGKESDRELCAQAGCDDFLTKPLDRHLFLQAARKFLPKVERRDTTRIRCHIKAKCRALGVTLPGIVSDISEKGIYLASRAELDLGMQLDLVFALPYPFGSIIEAKGRVAWVNSQSFRQKPCLPEGFGIELLDLPEEAKEDLRRFLEHQPKSSLFNQL